jgi:predicted NAD-dependent protein-ADP-ribosyltransferase YbiA (DUF1768 family)
MSNPMEGTADSLIQSFFEADEYAATNKGITPEVLTERDPTRSNAELFGRGLEAGVSGMRASGNYFGAIASTLMGDDEGVQESLKQAERHDREAADALSGLQTFEGFLEAPTFESGIEQFMIAGGQGIPSLATTITASIATGGTAMLTGMLGRGVIDVGRKAAVKKVIKNSADKVADGTADAAERELVEGIYGGLKNLNFKSGAIAGGLTAGFVPLSGENLSEGIESGREVDTDLAIRSLFVAAPQAALELASPAAMLKNFSKVAAKTADASDGILSTLLKETLAGAGKGFATEAITEAGQETISVLNRADMDPNFEFEDGYMRIAQAAFQGGVAGKIAGGAGGAMAGSAKAANSIFDQAKQRVEDSQEQRIADEIEEEGNQPPPSENAPYEPTTEERADIESVKDQDEFSQLQMDYYDNYGGPEEPVKRDMETGDKKITLQAQFREKAATAFESLAAKNPNDQRIQNLATRYVAGNQSVRDGILSTMFGPQRDEQYIDPSTTDGATDEQISEFFQAEGYQEATQEYPVTENAVKADPTRVFPNTEESRDAYEKAFGDTDFTDPTYAYMTEAFLRQAASTKQEFGDVDLQVDRDLLGKPTAYRLTRTDFKRDEQAPNKEFVEDELKLAMNSTFADGSGAEIVLPTGEVAPINLVNLTDSGRRLLQKRGDLTFQGGAQQQMARKGLPEFLSELKQIDPAYDILVNGVSLYGVNNGPLGPQIPARTETMTAGGETFTRGAKNDKENPTGAMVNGEEIPLTEVLQPPSEDTSRSRAFVLTYPDETKGEFKTEYKRYDDLRSAKQAAARAKADGRSAEAFLKPKGPVYVVTGKRLVKQPIKREPPVNVFYGSGENASLSNLAARPFAYGERDYLTVEHAYQTLKGGSFDQKTYDAYNRLPDATGKKIAGPRAVTKDNANITLMEELMKASFEQNADAAKALTDTGQAGITHTQDRGVWKKEFPRILTDIRKSLRPSEGTRGSSTQVKSGDAPAPQSGPASNAQESMGRQQAIAQYNADSLRMEQDRAKQEFSNEQSEQKTFFNPEEADAYAARLKNEFGFDNVKVEEVGMQLEPKSESDPDAVTGDETGLQQGDYNIDPDTGKRLYDGVPMTTLNLESNPKFQMDRRSALPRRAPRPQPGAGKKVGAATATYPVGALSDTVSQAIGRAMRVIRPSKPVAIMGVKEILAKTDVELREMFDHPAVIADVKRQAERMKGRPTAFGHYMGYRNAHMILIDNTKGNELQQALVASHELGHVLFQEEKDGILENPMLRQYMWRAFERARADKDAPEAYRGEENLAFEEWFADQVAIWSKRDLARKDARAQPRGIIQRTFGKIAGKLEQMWKAVRGELRKRFSNNEFSPKFDDFMDNVVQKHRRNSERDGSVSNVPFYTKKLVRDMEAAMSDKQKEGAEKSTNLFQKIMFGNKSRELTKWILAEDNMMRAISPKIADMFYVQAGSTNKGSALGFLNAKNDKRNELLNDLEDILGTDWETQEVRDALDLASSDAETATMEGKGRELRDWFTKLHEDYISQSPGNEVGFRENYWPIALDLAGIYGAPEEFIQTILQWNPEANEASIRKTVDGLVAQRAHILADGEIEFDATNPLKVVEEARILTENVPPQALRKFTESPEVALIRYVRHQVIRNEFLRHTRNIDGKDLLEPELNKLNAADRQKVTDMIERYLGYTKTPLNPKLQKVNSYFQLFNWVTLLPLATISSIPEMGGAILNTREFNGFGMSLEAIKKQLNNREQGVQLARSIGVTVSTAMGNLGLTQADDEYLDPRVRKYSDKFFKAIGLDFFTRFTREFASGMAVEFLKNHASPDTKNPRSERYLSMHGVDAATVRKWESNQVEGEHYNFQGPEGEAVKAALRRFVENSMLRPNAAERTAYGNDPRFALVWALKSYLYSFGKVIMGGIAREMVTRYGESDTKFQAMSSIGMMGLLSAAAFMPLAMFSLELRELAKAGIAGALPGVSADARYFRSDRMDIGTYTSEIFDRAGFQGPLSIFSSALNAEKYGGTGISLFGPTAGFIVDDIGMGLYRGEGWEIVPDRLIPGYSLVY